MEKQDNYNVIALLLTDNCVDKIDRSIQSILNQSFDAERIKIVAVDNNSVDGTYEKLIKYAKEKHIAVYRLRERQLLTRLLYSANSFMEFTEYKYLTILKTGDELYSDYVEKCASAMDEFAWLDNRMLICETDLRDESGNISYQSSIYSENCILQKREHYKQFFINGAGHKVQCFYSHGAISHWKFTDLPFLIDYTDWYKKAILSFDIGCVYIRDALACTSNAKYNDKLHDLILRLYLVKKLELIKSSMYSKEGYEYLLETNSNRETYEKLSLSALQYASDGLAEGDRRAAKNILLFAEMVNEDIVHTEFYALLKQSISCGRLLEQLGGNQIIEESASPPDGAIII